MRDVEQSQTLISKQSRGDRPEGKAADVEAADGDTPVSLGHALTQPARNRLTVAATPGGVLGRYVVLGKLGSGGMGTVLKAYDESLDRAIAIKLLHSGAAERHAKRLMREAQALAKLSHPNVVHVYEVGKDGEQWFIAMELVRGQTLREWQQGQHTWRECVKVYQQAGAGLMAAHAAGLVHRDFKPDNCIIDEEGRPRVLDFGLVREADVPSRDEPLEEEGIAAEPDNEHLTRTGSVLGTLAYMPLEQIDGKPADARSDQFSFCVSLYEALYAQRPFASESVGQLTLALMNEEIRPPPKGTRVPRALRRVLLRGLAADPAERWGSMDALLARLRALVAPRTRVGVPVLVGVGGLTALGIGLWGQQPAEVAPCQGAQARLDGTWDEGRRQEVATAILGTELSYAADTWARVEHGLDDYAAAWTAKYIEICEATSVRQEQSSEVLDLRMECLQDRLVSLRESVGVLAEANETRVRRAVDMMASLPKLSRCDDIDALRARLPPPEDPRVAEQVAVQRQRLARVRGLEKAGEYGQALTVAEDVVVQAEALGYAPLLAEATHQRGRAYEKDGKYAEAERDLERAFVLAAELGHDTVEADAVAALVWVVGHRLARHERGLQWGTVAAAVARSPNVGPTVEAYAINGIGAVLEKQGKLPEALTRYRSALVIGEQVWGSEHLNITGSLNNVGGLLKAQGQLAEALAYHRRALAITQRALGPEHPRIASSLLKIGNVLRSQGQPEQALHHYRRALAIRERALGPQHPQVAATLANIGNALRSQGQPDEALSHHRRALTIFERSLGPQHPNIAALSTNIGNVLKAQGQLVEALHYHRRALAIFERALGPRHPHVASLSTNIGNVLERQGKLSEALFHHRRALEIYEQSVGPRHRHVATALGNVGVVLEKQGHASEALSYHRRALAIYEEALGPEHPDVAWALTHIGHALLAEHQLTEARAQYRRALAIVEQTLGSEHPGVVDPLLGLTKVALAQRDSAAKEHAERAVSILSSGETSPDRLAWARFALARVLGGERAQHLRARELAEQARDTYESLGPGHSDERARVEAWLDARR